MQSNDCTPACPAASHMTQGLPGANSNLVVAAIACIHSISMCTTNSARRPGLLPHALLGCTPVMHHSHGFGFIVHVKAVGSACGNKPRWLMLLCKVGAVDMVRCCCLRGITRHCRAVGFSLRRPWATCKQMQSACEGRCMSCNQLQVS